MPGSPGESDANVSPMTASEPHGLLRPEVLTRGVETESHSGDPSYLRGEEPEVVLDSMGTVLRVARAKLTSWLGIKEGKPLWAQVRGLSPVLQDVIVNGRLCETQGCAVIPIRGRKNEIANLRLRPIARDSEKRVIAISLLVPSDDAGGEAALESHDQLDAVSRMVWLASGDLMPKDATSEILRLLSERLDLDAAAYFELRDFRSTRLLAAYGSTKRRGHPYPPIDCEHPLLASLLDGVPLIELMASEGEALPPGVEDVCVRGAARIILLPSSAHGEPRGILVLSSVATRGSDASALHTMRVAAHLLGLVTHDEHLSLESERSSAVMETAYAVARTISRSLDVDDTFEVVAKNAARLVHGSRCLLFELDGESGDLVAVASSQVGGVDLRGVRLRLDGQVAAEMRLRRHLQMAVEELVWSAPVPPEVRRGLQMRTALLLPMLAHDHLIGALVLLSSRRSRPLSPRDIALAEEVADQAAAAIHNARLHEDLTLSRQRVEALIARMARMRENERRDLAGVVHDDLVQTVVGSIYMLEGVCDDLPLAARPALLEAIATLQTAVSEARHIIADLRPPALEGLGLPTALGMLVDRADAQGPAEVDLRIETIPELAPDKASALYRIAREALVNAQHHAQASRVSVTATSVLVADGPGVRLEIRDDGLGWVEEPEPALDHFGIAMMEEQATLAGGSLDVTSAPDEGVIVVAIIPQ
jgi:two-component system, NarL family, sensor kinase